MNFTHWDIKPGTCTLVVPVTNLIPPAELAKYCRECHPTVTRRVENEIQRAIGPVIHAAWFKQHGQYKPGLSGFAVNPFGALPVSAQQAR